VTMEEVSEEIRQAHGEAFKKAVAALEAEVKNVAADDQVLVVLTGVKNELDVWEEECGDDPLPPIQTLESLRSQFCYVLVVKQEWKQVPNYTQKVHVIFDRHMGGGTSMSYKLFALFKNGLTAVRAALRAGSAERAFCELISLTKAMADNDEWYGDTDVPEEAVKIVAALGSLWSSVLAIISERDLHMLKAWLGSVKQDWEVTASEHLGEELAFSFSAKLPVTPKKAPAKAGKPQQSESKKRKSDSAASAPGEKRQKTSAETEAWLHRLDAQLPERQSSAVQLRCQAGARKRVLVFSGAYPLKAVGFAVAEAFGWAVDDFDPHPNKGKAPAGLEFTVQRGSSTELLKPTLKIVQATQEPGDSISLHMDGHDVVSVALDGIKMKSDPGFSHIKDRPMPRCVGGDSALGPQLLKRLNRTFFHDRKPISFIGCSKKEAVNLTIEDMARPIATQQGEVVVEACLSSREQPGTIPRNLLKPLVL